MTATTAARSADVDRPRAVSLLLRPAVPIAAGVLVLMIGVGLVAHAVVALVVVGVLLGAAAGAAAVAPAWLGADARALALVEARCGVAPAGSAAPAHARLANVVDGLCSGAGIARPVLLVNASGPPNAFAFGREGGGYLVIADALLERLSVVELEAVAAHQLSLLASGALVAPTVAMSLEAGVLRGLASRKGAGPPTAFEETVRDMAAVALTRYPPGLIGALERVRHARDEASTAPAAAPLPAALWFVAPGPDAGERIDVRVEALREL